MGSQESRDPLDRVAIALDTPDWSTYERWCEQFGPRVGVLKVGLEAFVRWGHEAVEVARRHARRVFLDLKLHDIPNTVRGAVTAARASGVDLLTVHASGGEAMLEAARQAAEDRLAILAVTLLTHLDETALEALDRRVVAWIGCRSGRAWLRRPDVQERCARPWKWSRFASVARLRFCWSLLEFGWGPPRRDRTTNGESLLQARHCGLERTCWWWADR